MNPLRGYTKIKIGGKERPFRIGMNSMLMICDKLGVSIEGLGVLFEDTNKLLPTIKTILYCGLYHGAKSDKAEIDFDEWVIGDWIDDAGDGIKDIMIEVTKCFSNSVPKKKESPETKELREMEESQ